MLDLLEAPIDDNLIKCAVKSTDCSAMPWNCRAGKRGALWHHYSNEQRVYMLEVRRLERERERERIYREIER